MSFIKRFLTRWKLAAPARIRYEKLRRVFRDVLVLGLWLLQNCLIGPLPVFGLAVIFPAGGDPGISRRTSVSALSNASERRLLLSHGILE